VSLPRCVGRAPLRMSSVTTRTKKKRRGGASSVTRDVAQQATAVFRRKVHELVTAASDRARHGALRCAFTPTATGFGTGVDTFLVANSQLAETFEQLFHHYRGKVPDLQHDEVVVAAGEDLVAAGQYQAATDKFFRRVRCDASAVGAGAGCVRTACACVYVPVCVCVCVCVCVLHVLACVCCHLSR